MSGSFFIDGEELEIMEEGDEQDSLRSLPNNKSI
jgi:hypothetical protein